AICFSCAARKLVLGTRAHEEFELIQKDYSDLMVTGFYAYGEIGPLRPNTPSRFHNETFISLLIGEE
ncbi:MAG: FIST C-terminal domain-containing protein, partial [Candidatus Dadabacteria bacterium]|nr:FIST C-terminal domain-containing protein [Candidatus Dadabacteria bacterium]MCZ6864774.1 FIST C-terminal domain-containing protein [Candidatus Dadabacteria bacterium]